MALLLIVMMLIMVVMMMNVVAVVVSRPTSRRDTGPADAGRLECGLTVLKLNRPQPTGREGRRTEAESYRSGIGTWF